MENNAQSTVTEEIEKAVERAKALANKNYKAREKAREAKEKAYEAYEKATEAMCATPEYKAKEEAEKAYNEECMAYDETHRNYMRALENEDAVMETYYEGRAYDDICEFEYYCSDNLKRRRNNYGK